MENLYIIALNYFSAIIREVIAKDHGLWNVKIYMGKFASDPLFPLVYLSSQGVFTTKKSCLISSYWFFNIYSYGGRFLIWKGFQTKQHDNKNWIYIFTLFSVVTNSNLREMCDNILQLLTKESMEAVLWPYLIDFLLAPEYTNAIPAVIKSLSQLAFKMRQDKV